MPYVPRALHALVPLVLGALYTLELYVSCVLSVVVPHVPQFLKFCRVSRGACLTCFVPCVFSWLTCLAAYLHSGLACLVPYVLQCLTCFMPYCLSVWRVSCLTCIQPYVPRTLHALVLHVPHEHVLPYLTCIMCFFFLMCLVPWMFS